MTGSPEILQHSKVAAWPLYLLGAFDTGVTVWSQQVRALNLAYALVEQGVVTCDQVSDRSIKIAVIGGGFAGLTVAAGLLKKGVDAHITVLEQCDVLMPLQQGSDARWLHPHIYDWPKEGSQSGVAMLPVMNWTAARASDVVVQILTEWRRLASVKKVDLFCNARHVEIYDDGKGGLLIEWVGERRAPDGTTHVDQDRSNEGGAVRFDLIVLATGFGIEGSEREQHSYWRNEALAQPSLDSPRRTFLIVGQGDGAMIDLLRLRISQYRQDRILDELFANKPKLVEHLQAIDLKHSSASGATGLFDEFERLQKSEFGHEFGVALSELKRRLRRDTNVVLRCKERRIAGLLSAPDIRISFQNRLLVYMLYKCGGFVPSIEKEDVLQRKHEIGGNYTISRIGVNRSAQLERCLDPGIYEYISANRNSFLQTDAICWTGGYFDFAGTTSQAAKVRDDKVRAHWRREYLPGPTALLGTAISSAVTGAILHLYPKAERLRVTLHRTMVVGTEELLQQTADYAGTVEIDSQESTAARTFPTSTMTIGLAYRCRKIVRSRKGVSVEALRGTMDKLDPLAPRSMAPGVSFVLAIPILEPEKRYFDKSPVAGVVYIDCGSPGFYLNDDEIRPILGICVQFVKELQRGRKFDRIRDIVLSKPNSTSVPPEALPSTVVDELELLDLKPPTAENAFQFNLDHLEIASVE
ncbi:FAD-dependent oxidoreductase [Afipia sp. GAS231]|uniref:FAD-dependent oxidoreductase n=1 Tax=Afipia sp. GAS231 TaxID=1882747 RepID=UPI00087CF2A7|nr:FAD-dependent oxidoreductase [Afipia sp. GAS231]SDO20913.1 FAD dependent oxidoreductase [Afipia sp. GAS231]